jgi:hypothetical protein
MRPTLTQIPGVVIAVLEGATPEGEPIVRWGGDERLPRTVPAMWMGTSPDWSACRGRRVVLGFEDGDENRPILLGLLEAPPAAPAKTDAIVAEPQTEAEAASSSKPQVLHIESEQELILECGEAKISLRADGRIVILGGYILSRSRGVHKIKGASVQIN